MTLLIEIYIILYEYIKISKVKLNKELLSDVKYLHRLFHFP